MRDNHYMSNSNVGTVAILALMVAVVVWVLVTVLGGAVDMMAQVAEVGR